MVEDTAYIRVAAGSIPACPISDYISRFEENIIVWEIQSNR